MLCYDYYICPFGSQIFGWDNVPCHSHKMRLNVISHVLIITTDRQPSWMKENVYNIKQHNNLVNELQEHLNNMAGILMIISPCPRRYEQKHFLALPLRKGL